jgi:hypothetical protein
MVALFIFAIGMLAVASMQGESIRGSAFSDLMTVANTLAEARLEELTVIPPSHADLQDHNIANNANLRAALGAGGTAGENEFDGHREKNLDRDGNAGSGIFTRIWNVAKSDPGTLGYPAEGLMTLVVVVEWRDQRGRHQVYASAIRDCPDGCPQP